MRNDMQMDGDAQFETCIKAAAKAIRLINVDVRGCRACSTTGRRRRPDLHCTWLECVLTCEMSQNSGVADLESAKLRTSATTLRYTD